MAVNTGFWSGKRYHLDKMTLPELVAAYSCSGQELLVTLRDTTHCSSDRA